MSNYYIVPSGYSLSHSGIQGMKWGIRRYQNEDGTLTPEGRIHYGKQAARAYYKQDILKRKQEKVNDFKSYRKLDKKIRKAEERESFKEGKLSAEDKRQGRYKVARKRNITSHVRSVIAASSMVPVGVAIGAAAGAGAIPGAVAALPLAALAGFETRKATSGHYYAKQAKANAPTGEAKKRTSTSTDPVRQQIEKYGTYADGSPVKFKRNGTPKYANYMAKSNHNDIVNGFMERGDSREEAEKRFARNFNY